MWSVLLAGLAGAGEAPKPEAPKAAARQDEVEVNLRGLLIAKPKEAAEGVLASFIVFPKKFEIIDERKAVNLYAKGDIAKQITEMSRERTRVELIGMSAPTGINVTKIELYTGKAKLRREKEKEAEAANVAKTTAADPSKPETKPKLPRGDEEF